MISSTAMRRPEMAKGITDSPRRNLWTDAWLEPDGFASTSTTLPSTSTIQYSLIPAWA
jgi:hypothetical protein